MTKIQLESNLVQWTVRGARSTSEQAHAALTTGSPLLVLMHGYGSNEQDLVQLAPFLPATLVCASLRAPLTVPGMPGGYAWFPLDPQSLAVLPEDAMGTAARAAHAVDRWIDQLSTRVTDAGGVMGPLAVLGFSQGGVMATSVMRIRPTTVAAAVVCSGFAAPDDPTAELRSEDTRHSGSSAGGAGDRALRELRPPLFLGARRSGSGDCARSCCGYAAVGARAHNPHRAGL
jgi:phospholipase/carboxylesterase